MSAPGPCPVCGQAGGFHDDDFHRTIQIPVDKIREKGWQLQPDADHPHFRCAEILRDKFIENSAEVTVTEVPPLVKNEFIRGIDCPHGVTLYFEPTTDQIMKWNQDDGERTDE